MPTRNIHPPTDGTTVDTIVIRAAADGDAAELARLAEGLGYPTDAHAMLQRLQSLHGRAEHAVFAAQRGSPASDSPSAPAARPKEPLLGWVHVGIAILLECGAVAEILGLVVDRNARRDGVGRRLIAAAEDWARARGFDSILVRSNVVRPDSHQFYPALGYVTAKTQRVYVKQLEPPVTE